MRRMCSVLLVSALALALNGVSLAADGEKAADPASAAAGAGSGSWIGVGCVYPSPALRAQLNLPEGKGLLVASVVDDGPAAKAGIKQHDVLLKAGGKELTKVEDVIAAVDAAKDKSLSLDLIRGGKPTTVSVTPEPRPKTIAHGAVPPEFGGNVEAMQSWIEKMLPGHGEGAMRFHVFHPGTILPPGASTLPPLPGNLTVSITRHGSDPAKIVVDRDGKHWEITSKELDQLPADIRPYVEQMLHPHRGIGGVKVFGFGPGGEALPPDEMAWPQPPEAQKQPDGRLEKRLEEMNRRIEDLQKSLEKFRQRGDKPRGSEGRRADET